MWRVILRGSYRNNKQTILFQCTMKDCFAIKLLSFLVKILRDDYRLPARYLYGEKYIEQ